MSDANMIPLISFIYGTKHLIWPPSLSSVDGNGRIVLGEHVYSAVAAGKVVRAHSSFQFKRVVWPEFGPTYARPVWGEWGNIDSEGAPCRTKFRPNDPLELKTRMRKHHLARRYRRVHIKPKLSSLSTILSLPSNDEREGDQMRCFVP